MNMAIVYILISVLGGAIGQLLLKKGMTTIGPLTISSNQVFSVVWRMATNPYVIIGLAIYVLGTFFWLAALSRVDLSFAYPFASLSYVVMLIGSWIFLHEEITPLRVIGSIIIIFGVIMISRS